MSVAVSLDSELSIKQKGRLQKNLIWVLIATIVMIFASLTSGYIVRMESGEWMYFDMPAEFFNSTISIGLSSIMLVWAWFAARNNNLKNLKLALLSTLILGLVFVFYQFSAWSVLTDQGVYFAGKGSNASGSFLYILSGLHLAHLIGGIIALLVTTYKAFKNKYSSENMAGIESCSIYWHFLGGLWIYLFMFLLFIR